MKKSHASLQILIQKLQDKLKKMKKLEEACKKQENVIQQMEKVLAQSRSRSKTQKGIKGSFVFLVVVVRVYLRIIRYSETVAFECFV